jgi:hypothetical protein
LIFDGGRRSRGSRKQGGDRFFPLFFQAWSTGDWVDGQ